MLDSHDLLQNLHLTSVENVFLMLCRKECNMAKQMGGPRGELKSTYIALFGAIPRSLYQTNFRRQIGLPLGGDALFFGSHLEQNMLKILRHARRAQCEAVEVEHWCGLSLHEEGSMVKH
jgi:hypothetical protein